MTAATRAVLPTTSSEMDVTPAWKLTKCLKCELRFDLWQDDTDRTKLHCSYQWQGRCIKEG